MQNQLFELAYAAVVAWRSDDFPTYNAAMLRLAAEVDHDVDDDSPRAMPTARPPDKLARNAEICRLYREGMSSYEIGGLFYMTNRNVLRILAAQNVERRGKGEAAALARNRGRGRGLGINSLPDAQKCGRIGAMKTQPVAP